MTNPADPSASRPPDPAADPAAGPEADLEVLCAGAARPAMKALLPAFESARGARVAITFGPAPRLRGLVADGTGAVGVMIGPVKLIGDLVDDGRLVAESRLPLGAVKAAVAVHRDAPRPDLSTPEAVRQAILAADVIVFNTASSGDFIAGMIDRLGIAGDVADRVQRFESAQEAMALLGSDRGRNGIGFGQSSAIRGFADLGVRLAAPLPDAIGATTAYQAARATAAPDARLADALLSFLASPEGRDAFAASGIEPES